VFTVASCSQLHEGVFVGNNGSDFAYAIYVGDDDARTLAKIQTIVETGALGIKSFHKEKVSQVTFASLRDAL
jgi:hypothetical protein